MGGRLSSLQALRAIAALTVVAHHSFRATTVFAVPPPRSILVPPPWLVQLGAAGVDVFFVISGFLMTFISDPYFAGRKTPAQFLIQRMIRIWPPYVVASLLACGLIVLANRHQGRWFSFDLQAYRLASLIFVPSFNEHGLLQPIIGPGWTLNYEAMFYACFALTVLLGARLAFLKLATIISLLFLIGSLSPPGVIHAFLGDPVIFEFLIGAAIGFALKGQRFKPARPLVWITASIVLIAVLKLCGFGAGQRLLAYGLPAAVLFVGIIALERSLAWPRSLMLLGDASYSIYLIHTLVIYRVIDRTGLLFHRFAVVSTILSSLLAIAAAAVTGLLFYWLIERPLLRAAHSVYDQASGRRSDPPLAARTLPRGPISAASEE